jgi:hypothetical protein
MNNSPTIRLPRKRYRVDGSEGYIPYQKNSTGVRENYPYVLPLHLLEVMFDTKDAGFKRYLGRTNTGGTLDHVKIELDLENRKTRLLSPGGGSLREALCLPIVPFSSLPGGTRAAPAQHAFKMLREQGPLAISQAYQSATDVWNSTTLPEGTNPMGVLKSSDLDALGTTAISRCSPVTPAVDLATAVAELVSERKFFSTPGANQGLEGNYLNYQLGIAPSLSLKDDLRKAMRDSDRILAQYERDAGRWIRRSYAFPVVRSVQEDKHTTALAQSWEPQNLAAITYFGNRGTTVSTSTFTHKVTFDGAFTYTLPPEGWRRTVAEMDQVYGVTPSLDTLWELVPFSFVADYFANMGDVMKNISDFAQDGLVMPYAYITSRKTYEYDVTWAGPLAINSQYTAQRLAANLKITVVQRRTASPFGFGFDLGSLTPRQSSILAALAISAINKR